MVKPAVWVGSLMVLAGVLLGFLKDGSCGSVFQPRDEVSASVNRLLGQDVRNCYDALDLTLVVWGLIGAGGVLLLVAAIVWGDQRTALSQD